MPSVVISWRLKQHASIWYNIPFAHSFRLLCVVKWVDLKKYFILLTSIMKKVQAVSGESNYSRGVIPNKVLFKPGDLDQVMSHVFMCRCVHDGGWRNCGRGVVDLC